MAFEQTLRAVQGARATATTLSCLAVILFGFVIKLRREARNHFLTELKKEHGDLFDIGDPSHAAYGGLALIGLAASIAWNGLNFIDLCIKKHYRFDRRVCIFVDIIIALLLLVTGFLTFMYDAVLFIALEIATATQVKLEIAATAILAASTLCHIAFFCYGCKDPNVAGLNFEHVPMQMAGANHYGDANDDDYHEVVSMRSRSNTSGSDSKSPIIEQHPHNDTKSSSDKQNLVEINLGKKVQILKLQQTSPLKDPLVRDQLRDPLIRPPGAQTPPRTPGEEAKRFGTVGMPSRLSTPTGEQAPFLKPVVTNNDWI